MKHPEANSTVQPVAAEKEKGPQCNLGALQSEASVLDRPQLTAPTVERAKRFELSTLSLGTSRPIVAANDDASNKPVEVVGIEEMTRPELYELVREIHFRATVAECRLAGAKAESRLQFTDAELRLLVADLAWVDNRMPESSDTRTITLARIRAELAQRELERRELH